MMYAMLVRPEDASMLAAVIGRLRGFQRLEEQRLKIPCVLLAMQVMHV